MFFFYGKTHNLQTWKYDVTSGKEYLTFLQVECLFPPKHYLKILWKSEHFSQRYKRKHEWVFFLNTVYLFFIVVSVRCTSCMLPSFCVTFCSRFAGHIFMWNRWKSPSWKTGENIWNLRWKMDLRSVWVFCLNDVSLPVLCTRSSGWRYAYCLLIAFLCFVICSICVHRSSWFHASLVYLVWCLCI